MAKLDQKFSKGSKSKCKFDGDNEFIDLDSQSKKKKRRPVRSRYDSPEYGDLDF
ncbi:hypothetical protein [Photobacterium sanguinicancri]|uniref:Uncharacterized protein n=1 Tax=Photobacterium sanguinicancri TaxID=875932 RepID=A0AAW7Y5Z4_9GAMM|nr:hypothetical protein [Photobacterium sanguinicancri]MDO6499187.1 hypothetical protein [Photobacterium sanguinicancri]MDO6542743.1 hypothetical protein [Photobacterium sanguinicancri]